MLTFKDISTWLNVIILGYLIFYTTDATEPDSEWVVEEVRGDRLSVTIRDLTPETTYYFRIRARNSVGQGPMSPTVIFRTPRSQLVLVSVNSLVCLKKFYLVLFEIFFVIVAEITELRCSLFIEIFGKICRCFWRSSVLEHNGSNRDGKFWQMVLFSCFSDFMLSVQLFEIVTALNGFLIYEINWYLSLNCVLCYLILQSMELGEELLKLPMTLDP